MNKVKQVLMFTLNSDIDQAEAESFLQMSKDVLSSISTVEQFEMLRQSASSH
ncbi:hypothetical protein P9265_22795 [Schinkia azotoformans]|uniref:hypothetical protein n=1 Tax=Schinkia azotoformans TaxID=1454 RepID=UPI002E1C42D3|nr:hypothetical protein [Schinkia azotoformans]